MARACQCDICGRLFSYSHKGNGIEINHDSLPIYFKKGSMTIMDICDECKESFIAWYNTRVPAKEETNEQQTEENSEENAGV